MCILHIHIYEYIFVYVLYALYKKSDLRTLHVGIQCITCMYNKYHIQIIYTMSNYTTQCNKRRFNESQMNLYLKGMFMIE